MRSKTAALASAAALLFAAGGAAADSHEDMRKGEKIKCEGVNSCKGHSDCKTAASECAGKNGCKGKGFMMMTPEECETAKAEMGKPEKGKEG